MRSNQEATRTAKGHVAIVVQEPGRDDAGLGSDPDHAPTVARRRDDAGDLRAVVARRQVGIVGVLDDVDDAIPELAVIDVDVRIDHADAHAGAVAGAFLQALVDSDLPMIPLELIGSGGRGLQARGKRECGGGPAQRAHCRLRQRIASPTPASPCAPSAHWTAPSPAPGRRRSIAGHGERPRPSFID
jgi:hypothetical protein